MSLEEVEEVLNQIERLMGVEIKEENLKSLEQYLLMLLGKRNQLLKQIKDGLNEPSVTEQVEEGPWWTNLYVYFAKGMILTFNSLELWKEWTENQLVEGTDYMIIPPELIVNSNPQSKGAMVVDGPKTVKGSWEYLTPFKFGPQQYPILGDYLRIYDDDYLQPIPFYCSNRQDFPENTNPPQPWLDNTVCFRTAWYRNGKISLDGEYGYRSYESCNAPPREGQPPPIQLLLTDQPTQLDLYKVEDTYQLSNVKLNVNIKTVVSPDKIVTYGSDNPKDIPLAPQTASVVLIKILKDVKLRPKGFIEPSSEPARKSQ